MLYLVRTTIAYCKSQDLVWDPRKDLLFLCQNYGQEIEAIRSQLNARQVQENFLGTTFVSRLPPDQQRRCYHVLLGADREPPPSMSLTPAPRIGHRSTASAADTNTRSRLPSHRSAPSLNTMQTSADFLSPPRPGKPRKQQTAPRSAPPTQTSAPSPQFQIAAPKPQAQIIAPKPPTERDSRSRYRHTSAPSAPNGIRQVSPDASGHHASRTTEGAPLQQGSSFNHKAQEAATQKVTQAPSPRMMSTHASAPTPVMPVGTRPQKSMPTLAGRHTGPVPVFSHGQNGAPRMPTAPSSVPQAVSPVVPLPVDASQRTQPYVRPRRAPHSQSCDIPRPPEADNSRYTMAQPLPRQAGHISEFPITADAIGMSSSRNAQAQPRHYTGPGSGATGLGGTKSPPTTLSSQSHGSQPAIPVQRRGERSTSSNFVFELDASPMHDARTTQSAPPNTFIAELPADMDVSRSNKPDVDLHTGKQVSSSQQHQSMAPSTSPPDNYLSSSTQVLPQQQSATQARPHVLHNQSASLDSLPASLMIGAGRHSPNKSSSRSPPHSSNPPQRQLAYQAYRSPPYSGPNSARSSPNQAPASMYKAYSGPISPPVQSAESVHKPQISPPMVHAQPYHTYAQNAPAPAQVQASLDNVSNHPSVSIGAKPPSRPASHEPQGQLDHATTGSAVVAVGVATAIDYAEYSSHITTHESGRAVPQPSVQIPRYIPVKRVDSPSSAYSPQVTKFTNTHAQGHVASDVPRPLFGYGHQRSTSNDSQTSTTSHDSEKLAGEYQADLLSARERFGGE